MNIVFHGVNAASFSGDFSSMLAEPHAIALVPDSPQSAEEKSAFSAAEVIISSWYRVEFLLLSSSFPTKSWTFIKPSNTASGRGGQPGTYTSTGMIWSIPCKTE